MSTPSTDPPWQRTLDEELAGFRLAQTATPATAVEAFGAGVVDPRSMRGLSRLRRSYPDHWHLIVWRLTRLTEPGPPSTVSDVLLSRCFTDQGMPRRADDFGRLKRYRASARRLVERVGGTRIHRVDDAFLERKGRQWVNGPDALAAETARRDLALLRRLAVRWAWACGQQPIVRENPSGPRRRQGTRAPRSTPGPDEVGAVLEVLDSTHLVGAAFAGGAGLGESEILGLRVRDLDLRRRMVTVRTGRTRGRPGSRVLRREPIAAWACAILGAELTWIDGADPDQLIFPNRRAPTRPRSDLNRGFAVASRRTDDSAPPVTLGSLRRLWQAVMRQGGVPRAALRQSYSLRWAKRGSKRPPWLEDQRRILDAWTHLLAPPVLPGQSLSVPRKSPAGCGPYQAELPVRGNNAPTSEAPAACRATPGESRAVGPPPGEDPCPRPRPDRQAQTANETRSHQAQAPRDRGLDESALRRAVRSEVEAVTQPLIQRLGQLEAQGSQTTAAAFAASAAGNLSGWAISHPREAEALIRRLASLLDAPSGLPGVE